MRPKAICNTPPCELRRTMLALLEGLRAGLGRALDQGGDPPAELVDLCDSWLSELDEALQPADGSTPPAASGERSRGELELTGTPLAASSDRSWSELESDEPLARLEDEEPDRRELGSPLLSELLGELGRACSESQGLKLPRPEDDAQAWQTLELALARLEPSQRVPWSTRAEQVLRDGGYQVVPPGRVLRGPQAECIVRGLVGPGEVEGLDLSPQGEYAQDLNVSEADPTLAASAEAASLYLWLLEHDPALSHALEAVHRTGLAPVDSASRELLRGKLLGSFRRAAGAPAQSLERLLALVALDEVVQSLLYEPVSKSTSPLGRPDHFWARAKARSRAALFAAYREMRKGGLQVALRELPRSYRDARRLTDPKRDLRHPCPKARGDVLASLRVWVEVPGQPARLGRALVGS